MKSFLILIVTIFNLTISAQTTKPLSVYLDCRICNQEMIKQELKNVVFVRDQKDSDVHIFFTTERNASGGRAYEIEFIGMIEYKSIQETLYFDVNSDSTELEINDKILKYLRIGLTRFWVKNGLAEKMTVSIQQSEETEEEAEDAWNKWSFRLGINGWFNGQESQTFHHINGSVSGEQITEKNKFKFRIGISHNKSVFVYGDDQIISIKKSKYFNLSDVISINKNWSVGAFTHFGNSLFSNYKLYASVNPGIEYNFFPYTESSKKQLVIQYSAGFRYNKYYETTIFNKDEELLWQQSVLVGTTFRKKWGSITAEIEYENFFHDMSLDAFNMNINTDVRLLKGLSLRLSGMYGINHNQINLSANGATLEEMLLQQRQIRSGYNYFASVGLNYSFGSIYNTIINSRFDF